MLVWRRRNFLSQIFNIQTVLFQEVIEPRTNFDWTLMLVQRRRRWANIKTILFERFFFAGYVWWQYSWPNAVSMLGQSPDCSDGCQ